MAGHGFHHCECGHVEDRRGLTFPRACPECGTVAKSARAWRWSDAGAANDDGRPHEVLGEGARQIRRCRGAE